MKTKFKKATAILLSFIMTFSIFFTFSATINAAEIFTSGDYEYVENDNGTARIVGYNGSDTDLVIPDNIDNKKVTDIGCFAFYWCDNLKSVTIPKSVIRIHSYAFYDCQNMTSITIPKNVIEIEDYAIGYYTYDVCCYIEGISTYDSGIESTRPIDNFIIYGYTNTAAETYAKHNRFKFEEIYCPHEDCTTQVVAPTCTKKGYTIYTCNECGKTFKADYTDALGHNDIIISRTESTCTSTGSIYYKCKVCGYKHTETIPKLPHNYEERVIEPSCSKDGQKIYRCTECGDTYTEAIPKLPHTYEEKVIFEPSCSKEGQKIFTCSECGYTYTEAIPTLPHSFIDTVIEPTVCADGYTLHKCSICGYEYTDEIVHVDNPVHNFKDGICTVCGKSDIYLYQSEHNYSPNTDKTWTVSRDNAAKLYLIFSDKTETEEMFDYIYIYDSDDNLVGEYTGTMLAGQIVTVKGDTAKIRLVTDGLNSDFYGFSLTYITAIYKEHIKGDVNGDGEVTIADATDIQKNIADILKFNEKQMAVADINGDGEITIADVTILQKYIAGLIDTI